MRILGTNAVFHDPAAALVIDGEIVAAAEEERFSRRKKGKRPVPFSTWELPEHAMRWCLAEAGIDASDLDAVTYSYDPALAAVPSDDVRAGEWDGLRTLYAERAPYFVRTALSGFDPAQLRYVPHHIAHAASAYLAAPVEFRDGAVLTLDGRGESTTHLSGVARDGELEVLAETRLPSSLGLVYEELTEHLGFRRSSDEYKVMAMASYGEARHLQTFRDLIRVDDDGTFTVEPIDWAAFAKRVDDGERAEFDQQHADLAATVQTRLEEVVLALAHAIHDRTGERRISLAGGVALNCVANSRLWREGPFDDVWVQPAAGDAGTALGGALYVARAEGDAIAPMATAALGRGYHDDELASRLRAMGIPFERPDDIAEEVAAILADDGVVAWYQGRSEWGPRALGHRSFLADPRDRRNLERMNDVKGREQFRPIAPMVLVERAAAIFEGGPIPSPYMLFTHVVKPEWRDRIPAVVHVDGTSRIQTVDREDEPLVHRMIAAFERRTGVPVVINTSLNTSGRPMVDDPKDLVEAFASAPVDAVAAGPFLIRRGAIYAEDRS